MPHQFTILYDEPQEAAWFRKLHPMLASAVELPLSSRGLGAAVERVLAYDRPDVLLLDDGKPILVVEETVEVPSGHNVGQRFARIAAAAENGVPSLYFGPYVAKKHGGKTAGRRFVNVRLFLAVDALVRVTGTAVTTINWPVDAHYEVRRDADKDDDVREYLTNFFDLYRQVGLPDVNERILGSELHQRLAAERTEFIRDQIKNPQQYDGPPNSVVIMSRIEFHEIYGVDGNGTTADATEVVLYNVGMNSIRSDPYTGMAMLYHYLYVSERPDRALILWFPNITREMWRAAAENGTRKDVRLYRLAADAILFADGLVPRDSL